MDALNMFSFFSSAESQSLLPLSHSGGYESINSAPSSNNQVGSDQTLLSNYWFNASMTFLQDIPQTIATIIVISTTGLQDDPNNPTGVSLPGYLDLIPQIGNTLAGSAATYAACGMFAKYRTEPSSQLLMKACLYAVFGLSTMLNGTSNIVALFFDPENDELSQFAMLTTFIALSSNLGILAEEELHLLYKEDKSFNDILSFICSINLLLSIVTALLATTKLASRNVGAYGYLWGTWAGQVPELVVPTKQLIEKYAINISDYVKSNSR